MRITVSHRQIDGTYIEEDVRLLPEADRKLLKRAGFVWKPTKTIWGRTNSGNSPFNSEALRRLQQALAGHDVVAGTIEGISAHAVASDGQAEDFLRLTVADVDAGYIKARTALRDACLSLATDRLMPAAVVPLTDSSSVAGRMRLGATIAIEANGRLLGTRTVEYLSHGVALLAPPLVGRGKSVPVVFGDIDAIAVDTSDSFVVKTSKGDPIRFIFERGGVDATNQLVELQDQLRWWEHALEWGVTQGQMKFWGPEHFEVGDSVTVDGYRHGLLINDSIRDSGLRPAARNQRTGRMKFLSDTVWSWPKVGSRSRNGQTLTEPPTTPARILRPLNQFRRCEGRDELVSDGLPVDLVAVHPVPTPSEPVVSKEPEATPERIAVPTPAKSATSEPAQAMLF